MTDDQGPKWAPPSSSIRQDWIKPGVALLVALKLAVLFALAWNSRFVMDEFVQLGWAKYLGNGLFTTVWHPKAVGYVLYYKIAHLTGWDATSILLIGRIQTALLACGTLAIVYGCARSLRESRIRALLVLLVLLSFSNFIERSFRTIAEPPAVFLAAAALLVVLRGGPRHWPIVAAGVLSGLAFLMTQKSVYFNVALGLALVGDALLQRRVREAILRGGLLVLGWCVPVAIYCLAFGGSDPLPILEHLFVGPSVVLSPDVPAAYGGLRGYVLQTLARNALLYIFCFSGMILALARIRTLDTPNRIALIFSLVITGLVFTHDQPWPYVFIMALPFLSLWALRPLDALEHKPLYRSAAFVVLAIGIAASFGRNVSALRIDNRDQLTLVQRAERMTGPDELYFDGVGMLPNRSEPSTVWLDRFTILQSLREGRGSEVYRSFVARPPKVVLWSYRLDAIRPLIAPLIRSGYVRIAPNIWVAGRRLTAGKPALFDVPVAGVYALYGPDGEPFGGRVEVDDELLGSKIMLKPGKTTITLREGASEALLLPEGSYEGLISQSPDNPDLFADVYN